MPKTEKIPKTEENLTISGLLNQLFPEAIKYLMMKRQMRNQKAEFPLPKYHKIMEELNKGNIPPQLDFFTGGQNLELQNTNIQLRIDQESIDFFTFLQLEMCKQLLLRNNFFLPGRLH